MNPILESFLSDEEQEQYTAIVDELDNGLFSMRWHRVDVLLLCNLIHRMTKRLAECDKVEQAY